MKQITINIPDNCELKKDGNTYTIVEKEKKLTYENVIIRLFGDRKDITYIGEYGNVFRTKTKSIFDCNNCTSKKQAEKLLAINKLMNVAKYLNGDWQPDWDNNGEFKYSIYYSNTYKKLQTDCALTAQSYTIFFKSRGLAQQAIEILGEETIKLALCTDY